jgi:hypothetical protein
VTPGSLIVSSMTGSATAFHYVDNKASWMRNFGHHWQYRSIERQDQTIVPLDDSALVFDTVRIEVHVADDLRRVDARALTVWNKSGGAWRVVAVFLATIPRDRGSNIHSPDLTRRRGRSPGSVSIAAAERI